MGVKDGKAREREKVRGKERTVLVMGKRMGRQGKGKNEGERKKSV